MSLVMQTCWNDLGLNLYVVPPMSHMVAISEDSLVRRGVKCVIIDTRDLVSTLVDYQASYYKVVTIMMHVRTKPFSFFFYLFFLILYFFSFLLINNEEAHDTMVT